jgi:hypothetical protein
MPISDLTKKLLSGTVMEWSKFTQERDKMATVTGELGVAARRVIQESLQYLKAQNIDTMCETPDELKVLGAEIQVIPTVETSYPNIKASVILKCGGATRAIIVNPNLTISAGGAPFTYDMFKKAIPDVFTSNAAEFVRDAFLYVARTGVKGG